MLDPIVKRLVGPLKPWLRRRLGADYDAWANWAQARVTRLQRRRGHFRGTRLVWVQTGHTTLEPFELVGPGRGEVLIRTRFSGVSPGTEIANFAVLPNTAPQFPSTPGYSAIGEVTAVGAGVKGYVRGDIVVAPSPHASMAIVREESIAKVPATVGPGTSLYMMAVIAYHGVHLAQVQPGERVALMGRGIIGQFAAQIVRQFSPSFVASVARSRAFVGPALERVCDAVICLGDTEIAVVQADVTFEVTGSPSALTAAIELTRPGGRIILLGSTRGTVDDVDFAALARRQITLVGTHTATLTTCAKPGTYDPQVVTQAVARGIADGTYDADGLVDQVVGPEAAAALYLQMADDRYRALGLVLDWSLLPEGQRLQKVPFFSGLPTDQPTKLRPLVQENTPSATKERPEVHVASPAVKIAILGCGVQGQLNAGDVFQAGGAELAGVMDPNPVLAEKLAAEHGVRAWTDLDSVLDDPSVDALFLVTPHHLHRPQVEAAAAKGKHVLVEKPLAANYAEAVRLVESAESAGIGIATWLGCRYIPAYVEAKRLCDQGAIGEFRGGELNLQMYKPLSYYRVSSWRAGWDTAGGGVLIMNAIHFLDVFLWLAGALPVEVSASYASLADPSSEVEDSIALWIRFANGALATVRVSSCAMGTAHLGPEMRLFGQDGTLQLGHPNQVYTLTSGLGYQPGKWQAMELLPAMKPMGVEMVERFAASLRNGTPMEISGRDGLVVQSVIEAAYRSARARRPVALTELEESR